MKSYFYNQIYITAKNARAELYLIEYFESINLKYNIDDFGSFKISYPEFFIRPRENEVDLIIIDDNSKMIDYFLVNKGNFRIKYNKYKKEDDNFIRLYDFYDNFFADGLFLSDRGEVVCPKTLIFPKNKGCPTNIKIKDIDLNQYKTYYRFYSTPSEEEDSLKHKHYDLLFMGLLIDNNKLEKYIYQEYCKEYEKVPKFI